MASDICEYNVQGYIHKLETMKEYEYPFERLKKIEKEYGLDEESKKKKEEAKKKKEEAKLKKKQKLREKLIEKGE